MLLENKVSLAYFISKRVLKNEVKGRRASTTIVRISVLSIAIAVIVNLLTIAVVTGFQNEVRNKVTGFGSHLFIMSASEGSIYESEPILKNQTFLGELNAMENVQHVFPIAYKPVLFQSDKSKNKKQDIQGAIIKGVDSSYNWQFFKENLVAGNIPNVQQEKASTELLISKKIAQQLRFQVGDTVRTFFVRNSPVMRHFIVAGIYETGLEEHDKKLTVGDIRVVQELNDWGITASFEVEDSLYTTPGIEDMLILRAKAVGGKGKYRFNWGEGYGLYSAKTINAFKDTSLQVVISDFWTNIDGKGEHPSIPDTAKARIRVTGKKDSSNDFEENDFGEIVKHYSENKDNFLQFYIQSPNKKIEFTIENGSGSFQNYVGGFEVIVKDWNKLQATSKEVKKRIEFIPDSNGESLKVTSILDNESDIFMWLSFLDLNVWIILTLMLVIGIINMGSALLVLILVRTNFIGILKAMGASNVLIRKVFLYQAGFLILRGMLYGNGIALVLYFIQKKYQLISLNAEVYYLNAVPADLSIWHWLFLNIGVFIICILALLLPSYLIARIHPATSIKVE